MLFSAALGQCALSVASMYVASVAGAVNTQGFVGKFFMHYIYTHIYICKFSFIHVLGITLTENL